MARLLLQHGAQPDTIVKSGSTSTSSAVEMPVSGALCSSCSGKLGEAVCEGDTPLCAASKHGNLDLVTALLSKGANIGLKTEVFYLFFLLLNLSLLLCNRCTLFSRMAMMLFLWRYVASMTK